MEGIKRNLFPILKNKYYFNTCSMGPLATPVKVAVEQFLSEWDTEGGIGWVMKDGWNDLIEKARNSFAKHINAHPDEIAYSFGNSVAISSITSSLKLNTDDEIVFNELDFPSTATHAMAKKELGINYNVVKSNDGRTILPEDYKKFLNSKTRLITACHVVSNTGFKLDIQELTKISHEKGIDIFIDAYQSLGNVPINVRKLDVDFLASGCLKWTLGGFGISFLYIRKDKIESLNPSSIGWMGVDNPFEDLYDKLRLTLKRPHNALKFQYGTPYPIGAASSYEGMNIIDSIGINKIETQNQNLTQLLIEGANDLGLKCLTPYEKDKRGSIVNIQIPKAEKVVEQLKAKNFVLDFRASGIRVSPHFFNNSEEILILLQEIENISKALS
jgi:selenocysteine lyase/cysteine desulfurase